MKDNLASAAHPAGARSTARTVAANSFWYGLEIAANFASVFFTSIAIARAFGPKQLGYFNYVLWIAGMAGTVGALGLPAATRKYMAEFLASGNPGVARTIFFHTLRLQVLITIGLAAAGLFLALSWAEPQYRVISTLIVLSLVPRMLAIIPSLANMAAENLRANAPGALAGIITYVGLVTLSLRYQWGLAGIAVATLVSACIELGLKLWCAFGWIRLLPTGCAMPLELKRRMFRFSSQSVFLMLVDLVVWNRSDVFFLKLLDKDIRQITFFSLAFNLSEKVVLVTDTLGASMGATVMAMYSRNSAYIGRMISTAGAYLLLVAIPLLLGVATLSEPLIRTLYGVRYLPAAPVLATAALFAVFKALRHPVEELLQASEEQKFIIVWFCFSGLVNVVLDFLLIPWHGAVGAAIANGAAQMLAIMGIWYRAAAIFGLPIEKSRLAKLAVSGLAMAAVVWTVSIFLTHWTALICGAASGCAVYCLMLRFTRALSSEDRNRLFRAGKSVPTPLRIHFDRLVDAIVPIHEKQVAESLSL